MEEAMRVLEFVADYYGWLLIMCFAAIAVAIAVRLIYKSVKYPKQGEATKLVRDTLNIWDPITGVPRDVVGKANQTIIIEEEKKDL
jgi:hypothetical protein